MKNKTCNLYSRVFWIFLTNDIKIDPYSFELYHFKVGAFFLRLGVFVIVGDFQESKFTDI